MTSEPESTSDGEGDVAAAFERVVGRMSQYAATLAPDGATEGDLDRMAVELTRAALKR
jgi:hypothetical protein